ncbi:MAG: PD40 domain-containing protein [Planctomycetes bacterium]|nr:PD40 domain-containing protein [Planctomycetota bacterium]
MHRSSLRLLASVLPLWAACSAGSGDDSTPLDSRAAPLDLLACRARVDSPFQFAEIALRSAQNLGTGRVADKAGTERGARLHPDGRRVVFARERQPGDADSRELFTSSVDGSSAEARLTLNDARDDEPCWSPTGDRLLFTSDRAGAAALWLAAADGTGAQPFVLPPAGDQDGEADWCRATDRVVFVRTAANGHAALWLANGNGSGLVPLTDGGAGPGDHAPAFAPAGDLIAFVRRTGADAATLCTVDTATFQVATVLQPAGDVATPRWSPDAARLFFGLAEPARGRTGLRLATVAVGGGEPVLLWPDERWRLEGLDVWPSLQPDPAALAPVVLPVTGAQVQIASGSAAFGTREQMLAEDGQEFVLVTQNTGQREVAGINCRYDLPVAAAEHVLELRVRAVARTSQPGADAILRMSIYNPVDERFDTVVELAADSAAPRTLAFRTRSLRHVTREKQLRVTVIADQPPGQSAELHVDLVEVELVARSAP